MMLWGKRREREHGYASERLCAYLDDELTQAERARVTAHLEECAECQRAYRDLAQTAALLRAAPQRRLPCSFVLPARAACEQARFRRWQVGSAILRTSTVTVGLMLVILLSADVAVGRGLIAWPGASRGAAPQVTAAKWAAPAAGPATDAMPQAALPTLAPTITPAPAMAAKAGAPATALPRAVARNAQAEPAEPTRMPEQPQPAAVALTTAAPTSAATPAYGELLISAAEAAAASATTAAPAPEVAMFHTEPDVPAAEAGGLGGVGGAGGPAPDAGSLGSGGAEPALMAPAPATGPTLAPAPLSMGALPPAPASTPTALPAELALAAPAPTSAVADVAPTMAVLAVATAEPFQRPVQPDESAWQAPQPSVIEESAPSAASAPPALRLVALGLAGLLLMLLGGLVWAGQQKRV